MKKICLSPKKIYLAYTQGYFPMPDPITSEIQWYRPDPRTIIELNNFHISRSLKRIIKKNIFKITFNKAFNQVIRACSNRRETWITKEIIESYTNLHKLGAAQSVEVWYDNKLAGGVYGINFCQAFFAESMFYNVSNASKIALYALIERLKTKKFSLLECQFMTDHLKSLGASQISDEEYMERLKLSQSENVLF